MTCLKDCKYQQKAVAACVSERVSWGASDAFSLRVQLNGFPRVGVKPVPVNPNTSTLRPGHKMQRRDL